MGFTCLFDEAVVLEDRVGSEPLHVGYPVWSGLPDLELLADVSVAAFVHEEDDVPHSSEGEIELRDLIRTHQPFSTCIRAHLLESGQRLVLVQGDLLIVFSSGENDSKRVLHQWHALSHSNTHLRCYEWVRWNEFDALAGSCLDRVLLNDPTVCECRAVRELKDWCLSPKCFVPLPLLVEINPALLELDALGCECVSAACREGAQIVTVESWILSVRQRLVCSICLDSDQGVVHWKLGVYHLVRYVKDIS